MTDEAINQIGDKVQIALRKVLGMANEAAKNTLNELDSPPERPFELDEVTVGFKIAFQAGAVVVGMGGDANLQLKFKRAAGFTATEVAAKGSVLPGGAAKGDDVGSGGSKPSNNGGIGKDVW